MNLSSCTEIPGTRTTAAATSASEKRTSNSLSIVSTMLDVSRSETSMPAGLKVPSTTTSSMDGIAISIPPSSPGRSKRTPRVTPPNTRTCLDSSPKRTVSKPRGTSICARPCALVDTAPEPETNTNWFDAGLLPLRTLTTRVPFATSRFSAALSTAEKTSRKCSICCSETFNTTSAS